MNTRIVSLFAFLLFLLSVPTTGAQATSGFVKIGNVLSPSVTFVDSTNCKDNTQCAYEVTAVNTAGLESPPTAIVIVTWGATTKNTTLTWVASTSAGVVSYNVYFLAGPVAPTALNATVN